jgi:CRP-like cAMP-binding protein
MFEKIGQIGDLGLLWSQMGAVACSQSVRAKAMPSVLPTTNLLIASLKDTDAAALEPYLTRVPIGQGQTLTDAEMPIEHVYFLEDGIASIVSVFEDGRESETGIFGYEGMSATSVVVGVYRTPFRIYMQVDGTKSLRIRTEDLQRAVMDIPAFAAILRNYVQVAAVQAGNIAAVNARFDILCRLARWLLMCHDRIDGDELNLTHESISIMLGVRRSGVSVALQKIESMGLIQRGRSLLQIVSRAGLEQLAGSAYGTAEKEYRRLIGAFGKSA